MSETPKITKEEYKRLVLKSQKWVMDYVAAAGDGMCEEAKERLFPIVRTEFRRLMKEDEKFYTEVYNFCSRRRYQAEKDVFCREVFTKMVTSGNLHRELAIKYPEMRSISDKYSV